MRSGTGGTVGTTGLGVVPEPGLGLSSKVTEALDSLAATWAKIDQMRPPVLLKRPEGSFTLAEYAERYALPLSTARGQVYKLLRSKDLARACVQEPNPASGRVSSVWCYYPLLLKH